MTAGWAEIILGALVSAIVLSWAIALRLIYRFTRDMAALGQRMSFIEGVLQQRKDREDG